MELALLFYVVNLIPELQTAVGYFTLILGIICVIGWFCFVVAWLDDPTDTFSKEFVTKIKSPLKIITITLVFVGFLTLIIPKQETVYLMLGAYAAQTIAQSPVTEQLLDKAGNRINRIIDGSDEINDKLFTIINQKLDDAIQSKPKQ